MERNNQNYDIPGMKDSRFSPEERAKMSQENEKYRVSARKAASEKKSQKAVKQGVADKGKKNNKASAAAAVSRNERVRNSSESRKKQKKLQNNLVIVMLLLVAVGVIGAFASFAMTINAIKVTGSERYSEKTVLAAAGIETGDSILLINPSAIEYKIESKLPYIENAEIKRNWPDGVSVELTDAVPSLAFDTGTGYVLMNNSCKVLDDDAVALNESALIKGIGIVKAVPGEIAEFSDNVSTEDFTELSKAFQEYGIENISEYDLTSVSSIKVVIDHRVEVQLGTLAGAPAKLAFCKAVIDETIASDSRHPMIIDITADGKAYARRKDDNSVSFNEPVSEGVTAAEESTDAAG